MIFETEESRRRIQADRGPYRKEYEGWIVGLAAAWKLAGGEPLETEHTTPATVRTAADGTSTAADAPVHTGQETRGGWFIVGVADHAEAFEPAKSLPTPESVEIRPVLESA
ncbi:YciI family protein [Streptomyces violascens]|uniref:hypothetical protein n=1 Tax=Streptomyces violascens TaxID=67381 RepID=UPI00364A80F6